MALLLVWAAPASAIQLWTSIPFCDFHPGIYATDEIIYVCGEWDQGDIPCPIGDIYITIDDHTNFFIGEVLHDHMGSENAVQGCGGGGAFFDAMIALPPLPLGRYDLVMDENQNGIFDGGAFPDYALGNGPSYAFEVLDFQLGTGIDATEIKNVAFDNALMWGGMSYALEKVMDWGIDKLPSASGRFERRPVTGDPALGYDALFHTVRSNPVLHDIAYQAIVEYLEDPPEPQEFEFHTDPLNYYKDYLRQGVYIIQKSAYDQVQVHFDLYNDPPDPSFMELVRLGVIN